MEKNSTPSALETIEEAFRAAEKNVELHAKPLRKNIFKRFPVFFSLFVTFGVASVFFGFERLLEDVSFLNDRPILILLIGIAVLVITGTLYKKL